MPIEILMPALSPTMTEGNLLKWHKKEGDKVGAGDLLAEIETDKATMEVEAVDEGVLGKILVGDKTEGVKVNTLIALLLDKGETAESLASYVPARIPVSCSEAASPSESTVAASVSIEKSQAEMSGEKTTSFSAVSSVRILASPLAKRIAQQSNIDLSKIQGSGPNGRIVKRDLDQAGGQKSLIGTKFLPVANGPLFEDKPVSSMRKVIAKRLSESKQTVPHFYLTSDFHLDALLETRRSLNENVPNIKITVNDFIIKAVALGLQDVPVANGIWMEDKIRYYRHSDIAVAVSLPEGLITPIIRQAELKTIFQISSEMKELAQRAKEGKLKPEEFQGGSFSISNLGMYNIPSFSAIVNPPQAGILAVGMGEKRAVIKDNQMVVATVMTCTLSVDHRVIDGTVGAQVLNAIKKYIENPSLILL